MKTSRTSGMLALGIAHIVLGALGVVASCVLLIGAIVLLLPSHFVFAASPFPVTYSKGMVVFALLLTLAKVAASVLLIVAGIRVLDVAPAGRRLSMTAALLWTCVNVTDYFAFDLFTYKASIFAFLALNAYPIVIELLFLRNDWRDAFSEQPA